MTRRHLLALSASALPFGYRLLEPQQAPRPRKMGLCLSSKRRASQEVAKFFESRGALWLYNWNNNPPGKLPAGVDFIPMIYNGCVVMDQTLAHVKSQARVHGYGELPGFNEPDAGRRATPRWKKRSTCGPGSKAPACASAVRVACVPTMHG